MNYKPCPPSPLLAVTTPGQLIDRITILRIKLERVTNEAKRTHVRSEFDSLMAVRQSLPRLTELDAMEEELREVNHALWDIEDALRVCERDGEFGARFVKLARSVYWNNDRRSEIKRRIDVLLDSRIVEQKQYSTK